MDRAFKRMKSFTVIFLTVSFLFLTSGAVNAASFIVPNHLFTPGAINTTVTQENISSTICVSGYTKTIRPSSSYTTKLKKQQLASTYSFYKDSKTADFEEDHLIPLELGGNPTDPKNLWPEPWSGSNNAHVKDQLENKLHEMVCAGILPLQVAQRAIANDWIDAYQKCVLSRCQATSSQGTALPTPSATPSVVPSPTPLSFKMPFFYQSLGTVRANWSSNGFTNLPRITQEAPPSSSFICKPSEDSDIIIKQDPPYNTPVSPDTQVTLTLLCHVQLITLSSTPAASVPTPTAIVPSPILPTPAYATPAATPTYSAPAPVPTTGAVTPVVKQCYVNGYTTKTGKVVSGYYRNC